MWLLDEPERRGVGRSREFERVLALPWTDPEPLDLDRWSIGSMHLWPGQRAMLEEAARANGLYAGADVGAGKTLVSALLPRVLGSRRALLLVPAAMLASTLCKFKALREHWDFELPDLMSYEALSRVEELVGDWDLLVCDEGHKLKNPRAARTRKVRRFLKRRPYVRVCVLSGTGTRASIKDFAHLMDWALRDGSPLPRRYVDVEEWSRAVDVCTDERLDPGVLSAWGPDVRAGLARRIAGTPGVYMSDVPAFDGPLSIEHVTWEPSPQVQAHLDTLHSAWVAPNGDELTQAVEVWRCETQLALGYYQDWHPRPPDSWFAARSAWAGFVRGQLGRGASGLDSPGQVKRANPDHPLLLALRDEEERCPPFKTRATWFDPRPLQRAIDWARENDGIVWTRSRAVGPRVRGIPYFGSGDERITTYRGPCVASVQAHGTGKCLTQWSRALVLGPPKSGEEWQQLIGRHHRDGQERDVSFTVVRSVPAHDRAWESALEEAKYMQDILRTPQKLLTAVR